MTIKFYKEGNHYHQQISAEGDGHTQEFVFKLSEAGTTSHLGRPINFKFTEDGDRLKSELTFPAKKWAFEETFTVQGDELEQVQYVHVYYLIISFPVQLWLTKGSICLNIFILRFQKATTGNVTAKRWFNKLA